MLPEFKINYKSKNKNKLKEEICKCMNDIKTYKFNDINYIKPYDFILNKFFIIKNDKLIAADHLYPYHPFSTA